MNGKLVTEHHLEFLSLEEAVQARLSLHLSKFHIVGNLISWLILIRVMFFSPVISAGRSTSGKYPHKFR